MCDLYFYMKSQVKQKIKNDQSAHGYQNIQKRLYQYIIILF